MNLNTLFNRYSYARNSPFRFIDPDGRYICDSQVTSKAQCRKVEKWLDGLKNSMKEMNKDSDEYAKASQIVKYMGTPGQANGVWVANASLKQNTLARADPGGSILFDFSQLADKARALTFSSGLKKEPLENALGSAYLAHEGNHSWWYADKKRGALDKAEHKQLEISAYRLQGQVGLALGYNFGNVTQQQFESSAETSTQVWCAESKLCN